MSKKPSLIARFFEHARYALKKMGDGFEASNTAEWPHATQKYAPTPPKRKYPH